MSETQISIDPQTGEIVKLSGVQQGIIEAAFYQMVDHPNAIKINSIRIQPDTRPKTSILDTTQSRLLIRMRKLTPLSELPQLNLDKLILEMVDVLCYLESNQILHNDIKPDNILWDVDRFILIDFGISTRFPACHASRFGTFWTMSPEVIYKTIEYKYSVSQIGKSGPYLAPEPLIPDTLDSRSDIFSLGATLYILLTGHPWFDYLAPGQWESLGEKDRPRMIQKALNQKYLEPLEGSQYHSLIQRMMAPYPKDRPLPTDLAREMGIQKVYLKLKSPVAQIPEGWTPDQVNSLSLELDLMITESSFNRGYLKKNALQMILTFFSLKSVPLLEMPLYLYAALDISASVCYRYTKKSMEDFGYYLDLLPQRTQDPWGMFRQFNFPEDSYSSFYSLPDFSDKIFQEPDLDRVSMDIASTLDFRTIFEF